MSGRLRTETQVDEDARRSKTSAPPLTPTSTRSCEHGGMQRSAQSHNKSGAQVWGSSAQDPWRTPEQAAPSPQLQPPSSRIDSGQRHRVWICPKMAALPCTGEFSHSPTASKALRAGLCPLTRLSCFSKQAHLDT